MNRSARLAAGAVVASAVLLLSGCGDDEDPRAGSGPYFDTSTSSAVSPEQDTGGEEAGKDADADAKGDDGGGSGSDTGDEQRKNTDGGSGSSGGSAKRPPVGELQKAFAAQFGGGQDLPAEQRAAMDKVAKCLATKYRESDLSNAALRAFVDGANNGETTNVDEVMTKRDRAVMEDLTAEASKCMSAPGGN